MTVVTEGTMRKFIGGVVDIPLIFCNFAFSI